MCHYHGTSRVRCSGEDSGMSELLRIGGSFDGLQMTQIYLANLPDVGFLFKFTPHNPLSPRQTLMHLRRIHHSILLHS